MRRWRILAVKQPCDLPVGTTLPVVLASELPTLHAGSLQRMALNSNEMQHGLNSFHSLSGHGKYSEGKACGK